jgi:hypothetical protein
LLRKSEEDNRRLKGVLKQLEEEIKVMHQMEAFNQYRDRNGSAGAAAKPYAPSSGSSSAGSASFNPMLHGPPTTAAQPQPLPSPVKSVSDPDADGVRDVDPAPDPTTLNPDKKTQVSVALVHKDKLASMVEHQNAISTCFAVCFADR